MASLNAEATVIGSILIEPKCLRSVREKITADDFSNETYKQIFVAACQLQDDNKTLDPVTIKKQTERNGANIADDILISAMDATPTARNAAAYAQLVHDSSTRRKVAETCFNATEECKDSSYSTGDVISTVIDSLRKITQGNLKAVYEPWELSKKYYDYISEVRSGKRTPTVSTGYKSLDMILGGGYTCGGLHIIAARPGVGKSLLGLTLAENAASNGKTVLYVSLEMSAEQLTARRAARETGISITQCNSGRMNDDEMSKIVKAASKFSTQRLYMSAKYGLTMADISTDAYSIDGLDLLVIDYLGLIRGDGKQKSIYERVTQISNELKQLALRLNIPVVCLAQLNRESAGENKRPDISQLRDSGAIEQDADTILLLNRPLMGDAERKPYEAEPFEVIIGKNRNGISARVLEFDLYAITGRIVER